MNTVALYREGRLSEVGSEGLEGLSDRISQLSERQAANVRNILQEIERHRWEARAQERNFLAPNAPQLLEMLLGSER
jgi:hypothetical protein